MAESTTDSSGPAALRHPPLVVGVMGSAGGSIDAEVTATARTLGRAIAEAGCTLITGACPGLPYAAVEGAAAAHGLVIGVSPALSEAEHVQRYEAPIDGFDVVIYTGSGLMGREVINIRSSDIVVIVGGHSGTLGEFAIAYDEGRLIGVLTRTGGIADVLDDIIAHVEKDTGAIVLYDDDPARLISRLVASYGTHHFHAPRRVRLLHDAQRAGDIHAPQAGTGQQRR